MNRTDKRVRTRARKLGYRLRRQADGFYMLLLAKSGVPVFYAATLAEVNNFLL
jgi:hypothetical protein